jgi:alginate O-acetyltransferase complex protein AlgI
VLFCSEEFLLFFLIVFAVHWLTPWHGARIWALLAASLYFYASWNRWLALVLCASALTDYLVARGMDRLKSERLRRLLLGLSLVANLGLLVYFKYANFFLRSLEEALHAAGSAAALPVLSVILPVGISFYTFEAINYTIDVYRRRIPAERNLAHFMLFILFFPHLIAGPIVRARDFLPQTRRPKRWDWARLNLGVQLFLLGLFKKLVVADRMALYVDPVFAHPAAYRTTALWLAALAWYIQIYCDFSGYSDMALGTAHMLGYKLVQNFNMPFLAVNPSEFWRRWHISLSSWFRDYLFIPLGGSHGSHSQTIRNLLVVMTLSGLWHGAGWTYVTWGLLHGLLLCAHRLAEMASETRPRLRFLLSTAPGTVLRTSAMFVAATLTFVVFRAASLTVALDFFGGMLRTQVGSGPPLHSRSLWTMVLVVLVAHVIGTSGRWQKTSVRLPVPGLGIVYGIALSLVLLFNPGWNKAFIYFQF